MLSRILGSVRRPRRIAIDRCYHYRGFRYGGFGNNPYEDYIVGLASGRRKSELRRAFADFVLNCRPRTMSDALQVDLGAWPLWQYPWQRGWRRSNRPIVDPRDNPDVVCQYCEAGVLSSHINREFGWLEGAWATIGSSGYQPRRHSFIRCLELAGATASSYLVVDGNHRLSALHALGEREVEVQTAPLLRVRRQSAQRWPRVRDGTFALEQALLLFDRYFARENPPLAPRDPATLIIDEPPQWPTDDAKRPEAHGR